MRARKTAIIVNDKNQIYCGTRQRDDGISLSRRRYVRWAENDQEQISWEPRVLADWRAKHGHSLTSCCDWKVGYVFDSVARAQRTLKRLEILGLVNSVHDVVECAAVVS